MNNSNSFVSGLLSATGVASINPRNKVPGWDAPVPDSFFGVGD